MLLVDDEEAIRSALSRALAAEGLEVDLAETGAEGLERALAEQYDLVILDLLMPSMDGRAVLRQLLRGRPGQAVLVLSCLADVRSKVDCFDLGARDYLTKPFSLDELIARVRNQLRGDPLRPGDQGRGAQAARRPHGGGYRPGPAAAHPARVPGPQGADGTRRPVGLERAAPRVGMGIRVRARFQHRWRMRAPAPVEVRRPAHQDGER